MATDIDHIGIAVTDLDAAMRLYENVLGAVIAHRETSELDRIDTASFSAGGLQVELMQGLDAESPVSRFIERRGPGIHHLAYRVADIDAALERARAAGIELIDEVPRQGLHGTRVAFLHPKSFGGVLTELVEEP